MTTNHRIPNQTKLSAPQTDTKMNNPTDTTKELQELSETLTAVQKRIASLIPAMVENRIDSFDLSTITSSLTSLPRYARVLRKAAEEIARNNP